MVEKRRYSFFITEPQAAGLKALKERDGTSESESIRQALNEYLRRKGALEAKTASRRAYTRRKA